MPTNYYFSSVASADVNLNGNLTAPTGNSKKLIRDTPDASTSPLTITIPALTTANLEFATDAGDPGSVGGVAPHSFTVTIKVTTRNTSFTGVVVLHRLSSTGTILGTQTLTAGSFAANTWPQTTGTYTGTASVNLGTFGATDRLGIRLQLTNGNSMSSGSIAIEVGTATDAYVAPWTFSGADTTPPITTFVSQTATKVSRVTGKNSDLITFHGDEVWQQYDIRLVSSASDSHTAGTRVQVGPNDQSFETAGSPGGEGWTNSSGASQPLITMAFSTAWASAGTRSLRLTSNGNIVNGAGNFQTARSPKIPIAAGQTVTAKIDTNLVTANGPELQVGIQFFTAADVFISQTNVNVANTAGLRLAQGPSNVVAPASSAYFVVAITFSGIPAAGATATGSMDGYFDNLVIQWPANQDYTATVSEAEVEAAGAAEGSNLLKVFLQDMAGNWST